ncbi:uncharacterized protein [Panulirus ornatus]|uniref:uncharacterized protein n=1 Tax=Panulirus ornatus TaxID=150431 RepID=UPI003A879C30
MAESDHEPLTSESGIRKFFRGILPNWPHSSPQGGATPIHNETAETGNEGILCKDTSNLKRKSSLLQNDESDDSDYEENLPSNKRQRITVSAMSRLFAEFSLRDRENIETPSTPNNENDNDTPALYSQKDKVISIPEQKSQNLTFHNDTDEGTTKTQSINNNDEGIPDMNSKTARLKQVKRDNKSTELTCTPEGKRQKTDLLPKQKENDKDILKKCDTTSEETVKTNKRQAETNDNETEENEEHASKVKRTRRLRRGLRLCTNITCYIEQVLYN